MANYAYQPISTQIKVTRPFPFETHRKTARKTLALIPHVIHSANPKIVSHRDRERVERLNFVKGINQPMVVFLTPTSPADNKPGVVSFDVEYFIPTQEVPLCGHGTITAIKIVLDSAKNLPGFGQGS